MNTFLISLYLKFNILLIFAFCFWLLTRKLAQWCRFEVDQNRQLTLARWMFGACLAMPAVAFLVSDSMPGVIGSLAVVGELSIAGSIETRLQQQYSLGTSSFQLDTLLACVLATGMLIRGIMVSRQLSQLGKLVADSVTFKVVNQVQILFSDQVSAPFSTRALGKRQIILPSSLVNSPANLKLAVKHEIQHLRNGDLVWVIFLEVLKLLCFWNPAVYFWHNEFDCLQEYACDEALITQKAVNAEAYGGCLIEVAGAVSGAAMPASSNLVPVFSLLRSTQSQLKRRVIMFNRKLNDDYRALKGLGYALLFGTGLAGSSLLVLAQETQRQEVLPTRTIAPRYPQQAINDNLEGWVLVGMTVTEQGTVDNARVLESCVVAQNEAACLESRAGLLNDASLAAIERFEFEPRFENGTAVAVEGVHYVFAYTLEGSDRNWQDFQNFPQRP